MEHWSYHEIELLKQYYPNEGSECYRKIKGKTKQQVKNKAKSLNLFSIESIKGTSWQYFEDDIIKKYYLKEPQYVISLLKGRTEKSIKRRAQELGVLKINSKIWSDDHIEYIKTHTIEESISYTGRSRTAIYKKLKRILGLNKENKFDIDEREFLRLGSNLQRIYPERTAVAIKSQTGYLIENSADVPDKYHQFINKWYPIYGDWIALYIKDVTVFSVIKYRKKYLKRLKPWTKYEDDIIRDYLVKEGQYITKRLKGRTFEQCLARYYYLGESVILSNMPWSTKENKLMFAYYRDEGNNIEYRLNNRSRLAIEKHAKELKIFEYKQRQRHLNNDKDTL